MAGKGVFQSYCAAIKLEIQITGDVAVAQGIVPLVDLFDVLHKLLLNIREQQRIKFAGAVKVEPKAHFGLNIIIHSVIHVSGHLRRHPPGRRPDLSAPRGRPGA